MSNEVGLGAWVTIDGLVNRADLNGKVGLVVRPDPGDGRLGVAIGVDSVRVKLSNLRLTDGTMPTPLRTVHTLDDDYQTDSPRNMGRFLNWIHGLENVDDANWFIGQVVVVMHTAHDSVGVVPTPGVALADGTRITMRRANCNELGCARCAQRRGGYRFGAVGPWSWKPADPLPLYCAQADTDMLRLAEWPSL